jgi:hypothetical protein
MAKNQFKDGPLISYHIIIPYHDHEKWLTQGILWVGENFYSFKDFSTIPFARTKRVQVA